MTPDAFLEVANLLPDATLLVTQEGRIVVANRACAEIVNGAPSTLAGQPLAAFVTDAPTKVSQFLRLCSRTGDPLPGSLTFLGVGYPVECRCDGTVASPASADAPALVLVRARPKHELGARFRLLNEMVESLRKEIGERKRAEAALRVSEELNRRILLSSGDCIYVLDLAGSLLSMNEAACAATDSDNPERYVGTSWSALWHDEDRIAAEEAVEAARSGHSGHLYAARTAKQASQRLWDVQITPMLDAQQKPERIVAISRDVTERRQAEEQIRQSAKMEAIGRMAGGLAHDYNNNLHVLSGLAAFVERDPGLNPETRRDLLEIRAVTDHMASLTRQLLAFSRRQVLRMETVDLSQAAAEAQPMLQRLLGESIEFRLELSSGALWVEVDPAQLLQVIMNLAINGRDAMPGGGKLVIHTATREVTSTELGLITGTRVEPGIYAQLTVSDDGAGIAPEHLSHIFEPFFTTKPIGEGTGLGLATVHGIVSQSRGHIWVESQPGHGSKFTILFQLAAPPASAAPTAPAPKTGSATALLLVIEDNESVRSIQVRTLRSEGFEVMQARDGEQGLECLHQSGGRVELIISDVAMPALGGQAFAERLAAEYPHIPVLWVSGQPVDAALGGEINRAGHTFLQKPVAPTQLAEAVRSLLKKCPRTTSPLRLVQG